NNNRVFDYIRNKYECKDDDFFIVLNPDVDLKVDSVLNLIFDMKNDKSHMAGINLYKDKEFNEYDNSVRRFPGFLDFFSSILGFGNKTIIDKREIDSPKIVDWVAGSFIAFTCKHFNALRGFDEHYFMYCEDIDICFRSYLIGVPVIYYPHVKAIHLAQHANRSIFSKHFRWHVESATRFLFKKYKMMAK
ncbi:glycosyltransferase family 2 protein, partial [Vibrio vulnificus]|uniref:glycosyltransferase family 2 protein n=1 Tax=Vibrio vulnificus TaxID=672 RepID=UPI0010293DE9